MMLLGRLATWIEGASQDIRVAARSLRRSPGWTAVALLTMALGVGASTTVFQVADALLIRPIAYRNRGRVFRICHEVTVGQESLCLWRVVSRRQGAWLHDDLPDSPA
jgi:hypothetical protein